jgi:hypothetical protein
MTWTRFRRWQMSNLPIRGISREWAETLFSVLSESGDRSFVTVIMKRGTKSRGEVGR